MKARAIIYVPNDVDRDRWEAVCLKYCDRRGYEVVSLVVGGPERWVHITQMLQAYEAEVVVVASQDHLPPNRTPRIESVTEELRLDAGPPSRRTRIIRRDEEASP